MEEMCSVLESSVRIVAVITLENAYKELMPASVAERTGTWSRTAYRAGVRLEVMLSLGLIQSVQQ